MASSENDHENAPRTIPSVTSQTITNEETETSTMQV